MPSLKRNKLLSDLERERLMTRGNTEDKRTRATNDMRVKKKLVSWLSSMGDVLDILRYLPADQVKDAAIDEDVYILFNIIRDLMIKLEFHSIEGEVGNPDDWKVVIDKNTKIPPKNNDLVRSSLLGWYIQNLEVIYGPKNPVGEVELVEKLDNSPRFHDRVTEGERKAIAIMNQAIAEFSKEIEFRKEPK